MFVFCVLSIFIGFFMITIPAVLWDLTESWKSKDAREPSNSYILTSRIPGGFSILLGIIGFADLFG